MFGFMYRSGRLGIIVKEFNTAPSEENKYVDLFIQHAHNKNHKSGEQVHLNISQIHIPSLYLTPETNKE